MNNNSNGASPLATTKILEREWSGLPNYILMFPVMIALSGAMATEREATIGLSQDERADALLDFRTRLLGDVLSKPPMMISITKLTDILGVKQEQAYQDYLKEQGFDAIPEKDAARRRELIKAATEHKSTIRLTDAEINPLYEYFPGWGEITAEEKTLKDKAIKFFGQKSGGRVTYSLLVEAVIQDYWTWATPRPTISVSVFTQSK
jgi:hypothetical protein